ncbi:MAG: hypothetical protein U0T83_05630 [Bacteriovoracaceae bacterium]
MKSLLLVLMLLAAFNTFAQMDDESEDYIPVPSSIENGMEMPVDEGGEYTNGNAAFSHDYSNRTEEIVYPTPEMQYSDPSALSNPSAYPESVYGDAEDE